MLTCPFMSAREEGNRPCLEENCAIWIPKGEVKEENCTAMQMKIYQHEGCCAIKALGRYYGR